MSDAPQLTPEQQADLLKQLLDLHQFSQVVDYCAVAAYTWFAFDYALTFIDEVRFVWLKPWGPSKILFLWMRYLGVVLLTVNVIVNLTPNHSAKYCQGYFYWEGSGGSIMLYTVELILQLRIYAMYNGNKILTIINAILYAIEIIVMLVVYNIGIHSGTTLATPPGVTGCFGITTRYLFSIWLPGLAFEVWLVVLAVFKAVQRSRHGVTVDGRKLDLLTILIRDSVVWFVLIAAGLFTNTMLWLAGPTGLSPAAVPLSHTTMFVGGSRLLLNIRTAYYHNVAVTTNGASNTITELPSLRAKARRPLWDIDTQLLTNPAMEPVTDRDSYELDDSTVASGEHGSSTLIGRGLK